MSDDIEAQQFSISEVADAAGCLRVTLDAWRNRNHLFADTVTGTREKKQLSFIDACVARAVKVLIDDARMNTADAIAVADAEMRLQIQLLLKPHEKFSTLFGIHKGGRNQDDRLSCYIFDPDGFAEMMAKTNGVMIVFDVSAIIAHVRKALKIEAP
ncbi:hypothetical protein H8A99_10355 [Bradyrhizobium sp. Arg68]|uniref:hypothetical protein n=1 Tax=Bradyrhizobium ivorense TaxID=2511166 RepID=UPI001E5E4E42|nr:hypothetical protein [Bradyrhizobium ivorense]MCC8936876.1 hypothetical protein [Bradyrhizobium ivorense]